MSDIKDAAADLEDAIDKKVEEAQEVAADQPHDPPAPDPSPKDDIGVHERLSRIEERLSQPFEDSRVGDLMSSFQGLTDRLAEALSDAVDDVEDVTPPDPLPQVSAAAEAVERAPRRVHPLLRKLWG